jgi:DNA invertase Pin-like site-specific DNA recombinase
MGSNHLAEFGHDLIRVRTAEARAVTPGVKMEPKPILNPHQQKEACKRVEGGEPQRSVARSYNVSQATISRLPHVS